MSNIQLSGERSAGVSRPTKRLKLRSQVWEHFDKTADGERAICKYCSKNLSGKSSGGTTHLKRHLTTCDKCPRVGLNQQLTLDSREEVRNIELTQKETLLEAEVKEAILGEVPLGSSDFQSGWYSRSSMKPMDVEKEIYAYYEREKENLAIELNSSTCRVCFSVDIIWTANLTPILFISITAHFINADFNLVRKLISFKELSHDSPSSIINVLESSISEWKLEEKIFTFTIKKRNGSFDVLIKGFMREKFSSKMLFGGHYIWVPCCRTQLMSQPYQSLLRSPFYSREGDSTSKFLEVLTTVPSKIDTFNQIAKDMGLSPINESWFNDCAKFDKRFICGEELLKDILIYREVFDRYYALTETDKLYFSGICSYSFHWQILELMIDNIPGLVDCAINEFRSFKHPSSHLYLRKIFEIVDMIAIKKKSSNCICEDGECRVHDYWKHLQDEFVRFVIEAEDIFIVAGVLDPRFKLSFFEYCMKGIGNFIGLEKVISDYREILNNFFSEYEKKDADYVSSSLVGTINTQDEGNLLNNNTYLPLTTITDRFSLHIRGMSELDEYLGEKLIEIGDEDFDLLGWWKQNQSRFPILSRMARDILAVPACVYSLYDKIKTIGDLEAPSDLEDDLQVVNPDLLQAVICSKDWILTGEQR